MWFHYTRVHFLVKIFTRVQYFFCRLNHFVLLSRCSIYSDFIITASTEKHFSTACTYLSVVIKKLKTLHRYIILLLYTSGNQWLTQNFLVVRGQILYKTKTYTLKITQPYRFYNCSWCNTHSSLFVRITLITFFKKIRI